MLVFYLFLLVRKTVILFARTLPALTTSRLSLIRHSSGAARSVNLHSVENVVAAASRQSIFDHGARYTELG
jgi:hypothetical protein